MPGFGSLSHPSAGHLSTVIHRFIHKGPPFVDKFRFFSGCAVGFPQQRQKNEKETKKGQKQGRVSASRLKKDRADKQHFR
jgi:hypothetical protein